MKSIYLTFEEFQDTFGFKYNELDIKLSTPKCDDFRRVIEIKGLNDLKLISEAISFKSFQNGKLEKEIELLNNIDF